MANTVRNNHDASNGAPPPTGPLLPAFNPESPGIGCPKDIWLIINKKATQINLINTDEYNILICSNLVFLISF